METKLAVGVPWTSPFMFTGFFDGNMNLEHPPGCAVRWFRGKGWCPARRHIDLCEQALSWGADLICILGADQQHPDDLLIRLHDRFRQGYEVITALVPCRGYTDWQKMRPFQPMAWRFRRTNDPTAKYQNFVSMQETPDLVEVIEPKDGDVQRINFIGSGVILFHRDHLLALKSPWFVETVNPETQQRIANMDCTFVWRLQREARAEVWVDTTIKVKHLHVFPIDDRYQDRFADWAEQQGDPNICVYGKKPNDWGPVGGNNRGFKAEAPVQKALVHHEPSPGTPVGA